MNDDATLRVNKVTNGSKIMVVGSTINDVLAVTEPALKTNKQNDKFESVSSKEPLCRQKVSDLLFALLVRCCASISIAGARVPLPVIALSVHPANSV